MNKPFDDNGFILEMEDMNNRGASSFSDSAVPVLGAAEAAVSEVSEVILRLCADTSRGLSDKQAEQRRKVHGLNEFIIKEDDPLWKKYLNQVRQKASYLIVGIY